MRCHPCAERPQAADREQPHQAEQWQLRARGEAWSRCELERAFVGEHGREDVRLAA